MTGTAETSKPSESVLEVQAQMQMYSRRFPATNLAFSQMEGDSGGGDGVEGGSTTGGRMVMNPWMVMGALWISRVNPREN